MDPDDGIGSSGGFHIDFDQIAKLCQFINEAPPAVRFELDRNETEQWDASDEESKNEFRESIKSFVCREAGARAAVILDDSGVLLSFGRLESGDWFFAEFDGMLRDTIQESISIHEFKIYEPGNE